MEGRDQHVINPVGDIHHHSRGYSDRAPCRRARRPDPYTDPRVQEHKPAAITGSVAFASLTSDAADAANHSRAATEAAHAPGAGASRGDSGDSARSGRSWLAFRQCQGTETRSRAGEGTAASRSACHQDRFRECVSLDGFPWKNAVQQRIARQHALTRGAFDRCRLRSAAHVRAKVRESNSCKTGHSWEGLPGFSKRRGECSSSSMN